MNLLNLEHVSKSFLSRPILNDVTVGIEDSDKIGIVGVNGTGKSTFLEITAGLLEPDEGQVIKGKDVRISYLSQNPSFDEKKSLLDNVSSLVSGKADHWDVSGEVKARLIDFGIPDPDCSPATLSGGQKKRAALVAAILTPCDLLILDEPTNHLDGRMIEWLESYLRSYRGALLMVTHDRYFLDRVTNQILELDKGKAYRYKENYSGYLELKEQRLNDAIASERKMAQLYKQDLKWMMRGPEPVLPNKRHTFKDSKPFVIGKRLSKKDSSSWILFPPELGIRRSLSRIFQNPLTEDSSSVTSPISSVKPTGSVSSDQTAAVNQPY